MLRDPGPGLRPRRPGPAAGPRPWPPRPGPWGPGLGARIRGPGPGRSAARSWDPEALARGRAMRPTTLTPPHTGNQNFLHL